MPLASAAQHVGRYCSIREQFLEGSPISTKPVENLVGKPWFQLLNARLHSGLPLFEQIFVQFPEVL